MPSAHPKPRSRQFQGINVRVGSRHSGLHRAAGAMRFALIEQDRNRLALLIVLLFVPLWTTLAFDVGADTAAALYPSGRPFRGHGRERSDAGPKATVCEADSTAVGRTYRTP
jgi:hypothetical protein